MTVSICYDFGSVLRDRNQGKLMKILHSSFGLVCLLATTACATASGGGTATTQSCPVMITSGPEAAEIGRLEERGARANVEGWSIEEARAFFAPEWVSVQPTGAVSDLDAVLSSFPNGQSVPWAGRFDLTNLDIRVYCDMAVVIGQAEAWRPGATAEGSAPAVRFRFLNVWRKVDGRWLYAANQFTRY